MNVNDTEIQEYISILKDEKIEIKDDEIVFERKNMALLCIPVCIFAVGLFMKFIFLHNKGDSVSDIEKYFYLFASSFLFYVSLFLALDKRILKLDRGDVKKVYSVA